MMDLTDKSQLVAYLKQNNLWAKKGLSQNFLVDKNALDKIVEAAELKPEDFVIEIGPGVGTLTAELLKSASHVVSIELDRKLAELLPTYLSSKFEARSTKQIQNQNVKNSKQVSGLGFKELDIVSDFRFWISDLDHHFTLINVDVLQLNLDQIISDKKYKVVANIPYHITSKILELFLSRENKPELLVLLVQKEVAERICAKPGEMSVLAVSIQLYGKPEIVGIVPRDSFFPAPKVDSAILRIRIKNLESGIMGRASEKEFFRCVHIGFSARRKTLINNLSAGYQLDRKKVSDILKKIGLKETVRAQELSVDDWKRLYQLIGG